MVRVALRVVLAAAFAGAVVAAPFEVNTLHGGARSAHSSHDSSTYGTTQTKQRPISKVIGMLKDMNAQLAKEAEEDTAAYDAFNCWCETNDKLKTKAIADAEQKIKTLGSTIEELAAKSKQLTTEIAGLETAIAKGKHALSEATAVRDKELAEFNQQDKDAVVAITGLHSAVETLKKHNGGAALNQAAMVQVQQVLSKHMGQVELRRLGLAAKQRHVVASFLQQPVAASSYSSNSGEIFGVLASMKESFESNLASSRTEEEQAAAEFASLKKAKTEELASATNQRDSKTAELATTDEDHANAKADLKGTSAQLETDQEFLADLKVKCAAMDSEWDARQKMRQDETSAVSMAIETLSEDDARDIAAKTTGFLQASMVTKKSAGQAAAARLLLKTANQLHAPKLAMLAMAIKSDVFGKTIESVKDMIKQLNKEKQDEVKKKDFCVDELHKISLATDAKYHEKSNLETQQADLESRISQLTDSLAVARKDIAAMQIEMKKASETREMESKDFTDIIADQRAMQAVVKKAIGQLRAFFDRKSLMQTSTTKAGQGQPEGFKPYRKGGGGMVIATLQHLYDDSHHVQTQSISQNMQSQLAYEEFMREQNKAIILLKTQITEQTEEKAMAEADLARNKADLLQNMKDLEAQDTINNAVHKDCDFLMQHFEQRQAAMDDEVDALYEAVSMMSGHGESAPQTL